MAASSQDKLMEVGIATATTLDANYTINDTSITVASTSGWPTATGVAFAIDVVDSNGVQVPGTYNEYVGVVSSATSITSVDHVNGTDRNYSAGATTRVYIPVSAERENRIVDWGLVEHDQDGTHSAITATSITATTGTFTNLTIAGTASAEGWSPLGATPNTVTANGNKSYDLVFNGTDLTDTISEGMRVRTARTVAAPTQCATFDGTNDYFSKSSPAGMTFTDDFVVSAWVKLSSYPAAAGIIASRYNGTSGWQLDVDSSGRVRLIGYNGGVANISYVMSYQSIPLNKWVHIAAQLDMSAFTATSTTSYIMLDGVDVPAQVLRGGTNPTALIQAGNLEVGSHNGGLFPFTGKIAQVAIYSAKVTQATIKASMNQGLTGSETSLISAYSLSNSLEDLSANNNDLTANGGVLATTTDSPFGNSGISTTLDYGIVMAKSFSTNTTLTVQVPEGCTIPTSGGVSSMDYSINAVPYGFPKDRGKWGLYSIICTDTNYGAATADTWYNVCGWSLKMPIGAWDASITATMQNTSGVSGAKGVKASINTTASSATGMQTTDMATGGYANSVSECRGTAFIKTSKVLSAATTYYVNIMPVQISATAFYLLGLNASCTFVAENALL